MDDQQLPTLKQLHSLSPEGAGIYATRNALRVLPLSAGKQFGHFPKDDRAYLAASISLAAGIGLLGDQTHMANFELISVASASASASASAASDATYAAVYAATYAVDTDAYAVYATDAAAYATDATAYAAAKFYAIAAASDDFKRLNDGSTLGGQALWPQGDPAWFSATMKKWSRAMSGLGLGSHAELYRRLANGEEGAEQGYVVLLDEWMKVRNRRGEASTKHTKTDEPNKQNESSSSRSGAPPAQTDSPLDRSGPLYIVPEQAGEEDHLGRMPLVNALAELLTHSDHTEPLTIGLLGDWGAGKTTLLNLLENRLADDQTVDFHVQLFNAWSYEHTDNIQAGVAQEAVTGLTARLKSLFEKTKVALKLNVKLNPVKLYGYGGGLFVWLVILVFWAFNVDEETFWQFGVGAGFSFLFFIKSIKPLLAHPFASEFKTYLNLPDYSKSMGELPVFQAQLRALSALCLENNQRLLFVVDDLDRCSPEGIVRVFEAIRLVMDLNRVTVIIAIDHRIALSALAHQYQYLANEPGNDENIAASLRGKYDIARDYLGKIIQLPINLGEAGGSAIEGYIDFLFKGMVSLPEVADRSTSHEKDALSLDQTETVPDTEERQRKLRNANEFQSSSISGKESTPSSGEEETPEKAAENLTMQHSAAEKQQFQTLSELMQFQNPRQLKRLHSSYRLLRSYIGGNEEQDLQYMSALFWVEYLYAKEQHEQTRLEEALVKALPDKRTAKKEIKPFVSLFSDAQQYNKHTKLVTPFVLPRAS